MNSDFHKCLEFTLGEEGGYSDDPHDSGNWTGGSVGVGELKGTKFGISAASYPDLDIKALTIATAGEIYRKDYWHPINGDKLPAGLDLMVFDFGVNAGTFESATELQRIVGVATDGDIGPITLKACKDYKGDLLLALATAHDQHYESLSDFDRYGDGWINRVTACLRTARRIAHGG